MKANQIVIDEWVKEYNKIRPHEALEMKTPSEVYCKSNIKYNELSSDYEYPFGFQKRKVAKNGTLKIKSIEYYISQALGGLYIALEEKSNHEYLVWLHNYPIGILDSQLGCLKVESEVE